ncbi:MAG: DUF4838 domain-containing protein [Candidatus Brocadiia bacterium]
MKALLCVLVPIASAVAAGTNIHPDPSFERTGMTGVARTGKRAGHLKVGGRRHWAAIGGELAVEPFATYRATAYVRGQKGQGNLYGLYCYAWNSFDWRWTRRVPLDDVAEWKRIEATFVSPNPTVHFHPLAAIDAAHCEAWVDDVAVEKVRSPRETMEAILARPPSGPEDIELRIRWHLAHDEAAKAQALAQQAGDYTQADLACLLARRAEDPARRRAHLAEMVGHGGLRYGIGRQRFERLAAGFPPAERLAIFVDAVRQAGFGRRAAAALRDAADRLLDELAQRGTCGEAERALAAFDRRLEPLLDDCPQDAAGRKELEAVTSKLAAARDRVARRRQGLGRCVIRVGGRPIAPATHAIVVPEEPTPQETFAAQDLNVHIEKLTGSALPLLPEGQLGDRVPIAVGRCSATLEKLGVDADFEGLGQEGIHIETRGPALALAGNRRGVLYAVYTFLETYCGCRWFTPDCTVVPGEGTFELRRLRHHHIPPLEYRSTDYPKSRPADWAVRNKINGTQTRLDEPRGGKIAYSHFVHTFNAILNPAEHFDDHPEWFSMVDGKRVGGRTQLCLTHPQVLEIAKRTVRRWIEEAPEATIFSVSQNDWRNYCQCPACSALAEKEGSQAGPIVHFVNAIARDIAPDYPDKLISTLAYQYSRTPPRHVRPEPNVCVRLCTIECDFAHPLDTSTHPQNRKFVDDIQGWHEKCNRLYIWDYIIDYRHSVMPWPNLYTLAPNIRFFIRSGVKGLYEEACYFTKGSEFAELRTWIIAKTMWDPDYDTDQAIDEFLAGYYGPAAEPIRRYIDLIHKPVLEDPDLYIHIWTGPDAPYLDEATVRQAARLFDQAEEAVADDPVRLHRVQVARLPVLYVQIATAEPSYRPQDDALVATRGPDVRRLVEKFERVARKEGLTMIREHRARGDLDAWLRSVRAQGRKLPIVRIANPRLELAILPDVGGRIWRMVHKPTGRDILHRVRTPDGGYVPDAGGYEEYSQGSYRSPGWNEAYRVAARDERSVTLQATLANGLRLTRRITLHPQEPRVEIQTTATNAGQKPQKARIRSHPCFAVTDLRHCSLVLPGPGGQARSLALPGDPQGEKDEFLRGNDLPPGQWTLVDVDAGLQITSRFDPREVSQCLLNRSGQDDRVNLELYAQPATLAPGESQRLSHSLHVATVPSDQQP